MALHLKVSNSLDHLAKQLCLDLQAQNSSVFQANLIVTQTEGMNSWLKLQMAANLGIAANYRFLKPNDLIHQVFQLLGGQYQHSLSPQNQCWFLYQLLGEADFIERFSAVSTYYTKTSADKDLKRLALAEKIADLFDQYQMYRPEMIRNWNKGISTGLVHEDWQMHLWVKARRLSEGSLPDKTYVADFILDALLDPNMQQILHLKLPHVQLVGISVMTDFHMDLFYKIGQYIELSFYLLNPAPYEYWFEDKNEKQVAFLKKMKVFEPDEQGSGNALLTSWGRVLQNTFGLLFRFDELINSYEEAGILEPIEDTLLHKIQADLFYNRSNEERASLSLSDLHDGSLVIQSCFTPVREVEALYNYLVQLIDQRKENLSSRDIVVMVSDIDAYAPYIKAIFNHSPYRFQFTIADESYTANDSISSALLAILEINQQNFKAEGLLQLLDSSYIRKRFELTDLSLIRRVVNHANFRFGMKGKKEDDSIFVSWEYAVQRILYGICMSGEEEYFVEENSLFPLDVLEGNESLEIIRFSHFMEVLMHSIEERTQVRSLSEWVSYVEKVITNLVFDANEEEDEDFGILMNQLMQYNRVSNLTAEKIAFPLFYHSFKNIVSHGVRSGSFATSGITFCSLIPMRSIPFKVVALLGLNVDKFPRKENQVSFNLIDKAKRKGDRNVKEYDKHLILETLLSAQQYLYLSYLGQNVKDNTTIPASALVDELVDYIQRACEECTVAIELTTKHPLHGFSEKYQQGNPRLYSYLNQEQSSELILVSNPKENQLDFSEIEMDALIAFLKHPIKGYFNQTLSIYYAEESVLLSETELFELDHLQKWSMKQTFLGLVDEQKDQFKNKLLKTGGLPLKNMATLAVDGVQEAVAPVQELFRTCIGSAVEVVVAIDLHFQELGIRLKGSLNQVFDKKLIAVSWSKNENKYLLEAYLKYLCARAAGVDIELHFISSAKEQVFQASYLDPIAAKRKLEELLKLFTEGHWNMLPFSPDFKIQPSKLSDLTQVAFKKGVEELLNNYKYPSNDAYLLHKYKEGYFELDEVFERYMHGATMLLLPLHELFMDYDQ